MLIDLLCYNFYYFGDYKIFCNIVRKLFLFRKNNCVIIILILNLVVKCIGFFIVFLINCNLIALINGKTDFAKLSKSLSNIMVTIVKGMKSRGCCASIAIYTNQILINSNSP